MSQQLITTSPGPAGAMVPGGSGAADQNPALVYLAGLPSERSRHTMHRALETVAGILTGTMADHRGKPVYRGDLGAIPWGSLRFQHVTLIKSTLTEENAPATANKVLSALRGVLAAAFNLGQIGAEDYQRAVQVKGVKGETLPAGRSISRGELQALIDACARDQSAGGVRDGAMLALLYGCGLRRAELAGLDFQDYDQAGGSLVVRGKGRKERQVPVVNGAAAALADWLTIRGEGAGPLFCPIRKGGHLIHGRLTTQAVYHILQTRAGQAGVKALSPHDFRRTFAGDLLDAGADIVTVQKLMGHADVTTTARYDRRPEETKRKAAQLLHVPYRRRDLIGAKP